MSAFRDEAIERMARAAWEVYQASPIATESSQGVPWEMLLNWAQERPLLGDIVATARAEAADSLDALCALLTERAGSIAEPMAEAADDARCQRMGQEPRWKKQWSESWRRPAREDSAAALHALIATLRSQP